jgi:hypothetical protein
VDLKRSVVATALMVAVGAAGAMGCKKARATSEDSSQQQDTPAPAQAAPTPADTAASPGTTASPASTEDVSVTTPLPTPPADQAENQGTPPSAKHIWVRGYWRWGGRAYAWVPGYWSDPDAVATTAPPAPQVERMGVAPGPAYFYAPGYWHWYGNRWTWAYGHWALRRDGWAYTHPYYEVVGGRWYRRGWGWERRDAAWDRRYNGWNHHGDVWVHRGHWDEWRARGTREGWYRHH